MSDFTSFESTVSKRFQVTPEQGGTVIRIRDPFSFFTLLFMLFWLGGWTAGGLMALDSVINAEWDESGSWFVLFWLGGWLCGELVVSYSLLSMFFGSTIITASASAVTVSRHLLVRLKNRSYRPQDMEELQWEKASTNSQTAWPMSGGSTNFIYGQKTVTLVAGVDQGEAKHIIKLVEAATMRTLSADA